MFGPFQTSLSPKQTRIMQNKQLKHPSNHTQANTTCYKYIDHCIVDSIILPDGNSYDFGNPVPFINGKSLPACICSRGWHRGEGHHDGESFMCEHSLYYAGDEYEFECCSSTMPCRQNDYRRLVDVPRFAEKHKACVEHKGLIALKGYKCCIGQNCNNVVVYGPAGKSRHCIECIMLYKASKDSIWKTMSVESIPKHWLLPVPLNNKMKFQLDCVKQTALEFVEKKWHQEDLLYQDMIRDVVCTLDITLVSDVRKIIWCYYV